MDDNILNKKFNQPEWEALRNAMLSQEGGGLSGGRDEQGLYNIDPVNMSFEQMEQARNFLLNKDATNNLLGLTRQSAGVDPVEAQQSSDFAAQIAQNRPQVGGSMLDAVRQQNGFPASLQNRNVINRFQKPTKEEKKAINKAAKTKDEAVRTPQGEENTLEAIQPEQPQVDPNEALNAAMGTENENQLINNILRGTERINAGLNLVKPNFSGIEALEKTAGQPVSNYQKLQKNVEDVAKLDKLKMEMANEKSLNDPNSMISQLSRNTMNSLGIQIPEGVSAGILKQSGVSIGSLLGIKESIEGRKEIAKIYGAQKADAKKETDDLKREKMERLSDKQVENVTGINKAISHIESIIGDKPKFETGPKADLRNKAAHTIGKDDPEISAFRSRVGEQLATYIKSISGAAVSEPEAQRLIANMPTMYDSDEVFMAKAKRLLEDLKKDKEIYLKDLQTQGKKTVGFQGGLDEKRSPAGENAHPNDNDAIDWAKKNIQNPQYAQDAYDILKVNGIL